MSFDGFFLHHLTKELQASILHGRIQKVNQPFERELVLTIRHNRQTYKQQIDEFTEYESIRNCLI